MNRQSMWNMMLGALLAVGVSVTAFAAEEAITTDVGTADKAMFEASGTK